MGMNEGYREAVMIFLFYKIFYETSDIISFRFVSHL